MSKRHHQPFIPRFPLLFGLHILPGPGWEEKLEDVTQVQPLQSLMQQRREVWAGSGAATLHSAGKGGGRFLSRKQTPASSTSEVMHSPLSLFHWSKRSALTPMRKCCTQSSLTGPSSKQGLQAQPEPCP